MDILNFLLCLYFCRSLVLANLRPEACDCAEEFCSSDLFIEAREFLAHQNELLRQRRRELNLAVYNYQTNVSTENSEKVAKVAAENAILNKRLTLEIKLRHLVDIDNAFIKRQAVILGDLGFDVLTTADYKDLQNAIHSMQSNYATTTVCAYDNATKCDLTLEPHIQERLAHSRNPEELAYYWQQWYDKSGTPMRAHFKSYVQLSAKASKLNNYASYADYWVHFYDDPEFEKSLDEAYKGILPLYTQLHAYVRHRLRQHYGNSVVTAKGPIPMHLLGNMWGQTWEEVIDLLTPYPQSCFLDITAELQRQKYTVKRFFELGDEFFKSLGMLPLPSKFWKLSVFVRPTDRQIICHASAWDLYEKGDVRIKMCTEIDSHYLYVVHHELGHIQYYLQYAKQPTAFRNAPNPGFHEAVGDVIALSVNTMKHFKRIGLSKKDQLDHEERINVLFKTALDKIAILPFAYFIDKYRFAVFRREINEKHWNREFWRMRVRLTGITSPVMRTDANFDPPAKYHIDADVEYNRYFTSHIFQFQFHKALCLKADEYFPGHNNLTLDNCDIFKSKNAGAAFAKFLSYGGSKNWLEILREFTGDTTLDTSALLEYFQPLRKWLEAENKRLNVNIGW